MTARVFGIPLPGAVGLPRDAAFSVELQGGSGDITAMCSCDDFLEIYRQDATFRLQTPESIDPERTNPNAPYTWMQVADVGSANPIIARVLLQSMDILGSAIFHPRKVDTEAVRRVLHATKESLIACEKAGHRVVAQVDAANERLKVEGVPRAKGGQFISPLPQVVALDAEATTFLISMKRAIQGICDLVPLFVSVEQRDKNFDHLQKRLTKQLGADAVLTQVVAYYAPGIRYLINLRNFQEHPTAKKRTHVENFRVTPDGSIVEPMWYVTGEAPAPIRDEILETIDFLVETVEWLFINLVMSAVDSRFPYVVASTPDDKLRPDYPIKYRLTFDAGKLPLPPEDRSQQPEINE